MSIGERIRDFIFGPYINELRTSNHFLKCEIKRLSLFREQSVEARLKEAQEIVDELTKDNTQLATDNTRLAKALHKATGSTYGATGADSSDEAGIA